jgi:uncharacterized protein YbaR (Trm112 family)/SAM-dependent methyltransferase
MQDFLVDMLVCPLCHNELTWDIQRWRGDRIEVAEARCSECIATYPVMEGIGLFLTPDLARNDLWEQSDSQLMAFLRENPDIERQLMESAPNDLAPADRFFRATILDERGQFDEAKLLRGSAMAELYTKEHMACWESQVEFVMDALADTESPIVDLACGHGYLLEEMAATFEVPIIATDFSPQVLRRNRRYFEHCGFYENVSLLAMDARRTPFGDGAVQMMTTNIGLPNIEHPGDLLKELRRVVADRFLAISHFFPAEDEANVSVIRQFGLETMLDRDLALQAFAEAGWDVRLENICAGLSQPTPVGVLIEGAAIDGLPVATTTQTWCVIDAS